MNQQEEKVASFEILFMLGFMMGNWEGYAGNWMGPFGAGYLAGIGGIFILIVAIWSIYWKGMALWHAARHDDRNWFIALLIINTVGILEILYLRVFSKKKDQAATAK